MLRKTSAVIAIVVFSSCTADHVIDLSDPELPFQDHIVMFEGTGRPIDPLDQPWSSVLPYRVMEDDEFRHHVDDVLDGVGTTFATRSVNDLFVFVHGGMNSQKGSVERARELLPLMLEDGYCPIFIHWQSSLVSSYFEHLLFVRQGRDRGWGGIVWAPFVLLSDLARTIARAPLGLGRLTRTMWSSLPFAWTNEKSVATSTAKAALSEFRKETERILEHGVPSPSATDDLQDRAIRLDTFPIKVENDERGSLEQIAGMTKWVVTAPIKIVTGLLVEGFGSAAWDMMLRRTHLLFAEEDRYLEGGIGERNSRQPENDADAASAAAPNEAEEDRAMREAVTRDAARLSWFFDEAAKRRETWVPKSSERDPNAPPRATPLVIACGHSMGAIVLNELVRRDTRRLLRHAKPAPSLRSQGPAASSGVEVVTPLFDDLVYLAPACSVADFVDTVIPYLEIAKSARVHVLVLHPNAEVNESNAFELAPRGSLLDWVDTLLTNPTDTRELRLGQFTNLMLALHEFPPSVRGRIQIHAFGYAGAERSHRPEKHAEFVDLATTRWWRRSFWEVWPRQIVDEHDRHTVESAPDQAKEQSEKKSKD